VTMDRLLGLVFGAKAAAAASTAAQEGQNAFLASILQQARFHAQTYSDTLGLDLDALSKLKTADRAAQIEAAYNTYFGSGGAGPIPPVDDYIAGLEAYARTFGPTATVIPGGGLTAAPAAG